MRPRGLVDYIGVGPVHATPTKPGRPAVGVELVRYAAAHAPRAVLRDRRPRRAEHRRGARRGRLARVRAARDRRRRGPASARRASCAALLDARRARLRAGMSMSCRPSGPAPGETQPRRAARDDPRARRWSRWARTSARRRCSSRSPWRCCWRSAVIVGALTVHGLSRHGGSLPGGAVPGGVLALLALGMYRRRYWAVLGFEALLAFQILVTSLALVVASTLARGGAVPGHDRARGLAVLEARAGDGPHPGRRASVAAAPSGLGCGLRLR